MNILTEYLKKLVKYVPKNMGAVVGMAQTAVTFAREVCMLAARLVCPIIPGDADEKAVKKIHDGAKVVLDFLEKLKNWLLILGFKATDTTKTE